MQVRMQVLVLPHPHSFVATFHNFHCNDKRTTHFLFKKRSLHKDNRYFSTKIEQQENAPKPLAELSYLTQCKAFKELCNGVQSVHGLVCASTMFDDPVSVLNPTTRESIELPHTDVLVQTEGVSPFAQYYFGFSPLTNEYKVLQIIKVNPSGLGKLDIGLLNIFTIGTDSSWRPLRVDQHSDLLEELGSGVGINGVVHWLHEKQKVIVAFDVREETFRVLPYPKIMLKCLMIMLIKIIISIVMEVLPILIAYKVQLWLRWGECVGVFVDKSWKQDKIVLWILKDYQNHAWVKETVSLMLKETYGENGCYVQALGTIHTGQLALVHYLNGLKPGFDTGPPQLLLYDVKTKQFRIISFVFPDSQRMYDINLITSYEDSIVPLK
ncbi:putative F-box protein At1g53550 [Prunus avium]|uniref:F-box protein At1g53550 n=1 Tax=Prunus avium TaxID=42229 RepID=A0A6P5SMY6_PRUAV|nr:putative F-box protein At1g53550 [Prunus avium]